MVEKIYDIKNQILTHIDKQLKERGGVENVNVAQYGQMVDMVKDLAEAEEKCWKAQYYRNLVSESMEKKYGYTSQGGTGSSATAGYGGMRSGYSQQGMQSARSGYGNMSGHQEVTALVERMEMASPEEKEHIMNELRMKVGM